MSLTNEAENEQLVLPTIYNILLSKKKISCEEIASTNNINYKRVWMTCIFL